MADFKLASGVTVTNLEGIHPCYEVLEKETYSSFLINIDINVLEQLLDQFCNELDEPCFFILEVPTNENDERTLRKSNSDPFHRDVYYWDGCSREMLKDIMRQYGTLLLNDGMSRFGFASHRSKDEIYVGKYKITNILTKNAQKYHQMLAAYDIPYEEQIKTVWKNFSSETPGEARIIQIDGINVYDLVEILLKQGLYFAERREE